MAEIIESNDAIKYLLSHDSETIRQRMLHPIFFKLYLLRKLPLAFFAGVKIHRLDMERCDVSIPYRWLSTNPFRSTYFAALSMAAELSTGALALMMVENSPDSIASLIVGLKANFTKKADSLTTFTCNEGTKISSAVERASNTGEAVVIDVQSIGHNPDQLTVAEFTFTWSFKKRMKN